MRKPKNILLAIAAVAVLAILVFQLRTDNSLSDFLQRGTIRIGYAVEAPYAFLSSEGAVTGESPEIAKIIVAQLGIGRIEWQQLEFDALIPALEAGRIDVIASGLFITPERAKHVSFSEPTFHVKPGLLVRKGNPLQLHSYQQAVMQAGVKVAALSGAVEETLLLRMGLPKSRLVIVPDALTGRVAVEHGLADCLSLSSPTVQWMALRYQLGRTEAVRPFEEPADSSHFGYGAFAFRKKDHQLLSAWNTALKTYIGSPEHRALVAKYGFTEAELPGPITLKEVLSQ